MAANMLPPANELISWVVTLSGSSAVYGLCIAPLTAEERLMLSITSVLGLWATLALILLLQVAFSRLCSRYACCQSSLARTIKLKFGYAPVRFWRSACDLYLFSYTTLATSLLGYLICIQVGDHHVVWSSPAISCDSASWRSWSIVAGIVLVLAVVLPAVAIVAFLHRHRQRFAEEDFSARYGILYQHLTPRTYWWVGMVLLRRAIFAVVSLAYLTDSHSGGLVFACLHLVSLLIHIRFQPYASAISNRAEFFTLVSLTVLGMLTATFTDHEIVSSTSRSVLATLLVSTLR